MIVSHPARFFIATPTKVGTHSLEAVATRPANAGALELVGATHGDRRRRMHRMAPDPLWGEYNGVLLVRNPWSRWVSVYEYLRAPKFYSQWGARDVQGTAWGGKNERVRASLGQPMTFEDFLGWMRDQRALHYTPAALAKRGPVTTSYAYRSPWVWTDSLIVSLRLLDRNLNGTGPARLLHMEHLAEELPPLLDGIPDLDLHVDRLNKTTDPTHPRWQTYWQSRAARRHATYLGIAQEAADLGYPPDPEEHA